MAMVVVVVVVVVLSSRAICTSIFTCYFMHAFYLFIYQSMALGARVMTMGTESFRSNVVCQVKTITYFEILSLCSGFMF